MVEAADLDGLSVLVVEDEEPMRLLVCRMLKRMKVAATVAADSGEAALERLAVREKIDLVICDWTMPGMSGIELFQRIREDWPELPFLMLSGRADVDSVAEAKRAGVSGYVVKPISRQTLKTGIISVLGRSPE
jgi:two-component system, chemotaxis family, chemotaxis protein CheY